MRFKHISRIAVVTAALALASIAFAATNTGGLSLAQGASVNGTALKAGSYKVQWEGAGENLTVTILDGKKVLLKAPAHMTELGSKSGSDSVLLNGDEGRQTIAQIRFAGSTHALVFGGQTDGKAAGN